MDFKLGQKDYKSEQGFQIGAKRFQVGARLKIGARGISNRGRDCKSLQNKWLPKFLLLTLISFFR